MNRHHTLNHRRQHWCCGNRLVISDWGGRWTFWNWGDIGLSPASKKSIQTKKLHKHWSETGFQNISTSLEKKRMPCSSLLPRENIPNGSVSPYRSKSNKVKRRRTSHDLKAEGARLGDGWQVGGRSTGSLDYVLSKWSDSRSDLPTDWHVPVYHLHQQTEALANPSRTQQSIRIHGPPLMRLGVHKYFVV